MISHARRCGYAWIKAAKDRGIDINADKDGYLAVISGLIDELESDATRCPNCENLRLERNEYARWRKDLADKLDEVERMRDVLARTVNMLKSKGDMLAAVVQGAKEEFVRVPYGASHEDVAAINDWHRMADEALKEWK